MTQLYRLQGDALVPIASGRLAREEMIEDWVVRQPGLLGLDMMVIGRQVTTDFGGRIDLLGIDVDGNIVIVELKRDRTPREIIAQVLDYASWVAPLTTRQVHEIALAYLHERLDTAFRRHFDADLPATLTPRTRWSSWRASSTRHRSVLSGTFPRSTNWESTRRSSPSSSTTARPL